MSLSTSLLRSRIRSLMDSVYRDLVSEFLYATFTRLFVRGIVKDPINFKIDSRLKLSSERKMPLRVYRIVI
jgi:hypothetical protein